MEMREIISSERPPAPWTAGDNIPWNDPEFSRRMLREHLSQEHDAASRRTPVIQGHVAWIDGTVLGSRPSRVLDLGCGPGLYTIALARRGHACVGIDWSPASLAYALDAAAQEGVDAVHLEGDIRTAPYGDGFDLVMLLYGEFNVFKPADTETILRKAFAAVKPGGRLLLEVQTEDDVRARGERRRTWYPSKGGLWSDRAHLCLEESFWSAGSRAATVRYFIVDAETGETSRFGASYQAYSPADYAGVLERAGFVRMQLLPGLGEFVQPGFIAILAERP